MTGQYPSVRWGTGGVILAAVLVGVAGNGSHWDGNAAQIHCAARDVNSPSEAGQSCLGNALNPDVKAVIAGRDVVDDHGL
jgi:hypothetical protein